MSVSPETVVSPVEELGRRLTLEQQGKRPKQPIHVALVTQGPPGPNAGGTVIAGWGLLTWLKAQGHRVTVVLLPMPWQGLPANRAALDPLGVSVIDLSAPTDLPPPTLGQRVANFKWWAALFADAFPAERLAMRVNAELERASPDVVLAQHYQGLAAIQRVRRIPRMALLGDPEHLVRYYRWRYGFSEGSFMRQTGLFMSWFNAWVQTPRLVRMMRSCEALAATAAHHARWYAARAHRPCLYAPTPIVDSAGTDWRTRRLPRNAEGRCTIIHLGNLGGTTNRPSIELLLHDVVPMLDRAFGPDLYELHFIGYPAGMPQRLHLAAAQRPNIKIRGFLSGTQMDDAFRGADVLIVPNPMRLGNRVRIATAFAFGCPVVSHLANQAGMPELVHDRNVRFAETGQRLGEELVQVLRDPVLHRRLGEEGRRTYEQHYAASVVCDRIGEELVRISGVGVSGGRPP